MDKVFREPKELVPITHTEFNEFIKGKGFTGRILQIKRFEGHVWI